MNLMSEIDQLVITLYEITDKEISAVLAFNKWFGSV